MNLTFSQKRCCTQNQSRRHYACTWERPHHYRGRCSFSGLDLCASGIVDTSDKFSPRLPLKGCVDSIDQEKYSHLLFPGTILREYKILTNRK